MKKKYIIIIILFVVLLNGCSVKTESFDKIKSKYIKQIDKVINNMNNNTNINEKDNNSTNYIKDKTNKQLDLDNLIKDALINGESKIDVSSYDNITANEIFDLVEDIVYENPLILYYKGSEYWTNGILKFNYKKDKKVIFNHRKEIENKLDDIISLVIKPSMTNYQKIKVIHDYIINNAKYDSNYYTSDKVKDESYSAYGVLINGVGVCESYSKAMKLLLDKLEIDNMIIIGQANNIDHAWNLVKIEDSYYHVDLTWDDPVMSDNSDVIRYDYFNLSDKLMKKDHKWDKSNYPLCDSNKYNYYYLNNMIINNSDEFYNKLKDILVNKKRESILKIIDYDKSVYDVSLAINEIIKNDKSITYNKLTYSVNEETGVISITLK